MVSPMSIAENSPNNGPEISVIAAGFAGCQATAGVEAGPAAILEIGLLGSLKQDLGLSVHFDNQVHYYSEIIPQVDPPYQNMNRPRTVSAVTQKLSAQVYEHVSKGRRVLTLGGDHSIGIGTVSGVAKAVKDTLKKDLAVIWVDAHGDINTPQTSGSGNIHGMPLAFLTGLVVEKPVDIFGWLQKDHLIKPQNLVYIGLRDLDDSEIQHLKEHNIRTFGMDDVRKLGIEKVMEQTLEWIGSENPIHMSFDIDSLDPECAPSTRLPVPGGLSVQEGKYIAERVYRSGRLVGIDLVEINPEIDKTRSSQTIRAGLDVLFAALGKIS